MLWMKVSNDKYELPVAVADTAAELANILGVKKNAIYSSISHFERGDSKNCSYVRVKERCIDD